MTYLVRHRRLGALVRTAFAIGTIGLLAGCGALDVSDPTRIEDDDLTNETGADLLRRDILFRLYRAAGGGALTSGIFADEYFYDLPSFSLTGTYRDLDQRITLSDPTVYGSWSSVRTAASTAIPKLRSYTTRAGKSPLTGQALAARGYATLRMAEDYCPGFPLHEIANYKPVYGGPLTTAAAFERALADFDSALVEAADSAAVLDFARVGRGRVLLGLGRFAEAGLAVADVPTTYVLNAEYSGTFEPFQPNPLYFPPFILSTGIASAEGGVGVDFVAAADPRLPTQLAGMAEDGVTGIYTAVKYGSMAAPIVLASGIEARLIQAEAALQGGGDWLAILNDLRATQVTPALPALGDPGTDAARVDLLVRERAFWLFGTGHRLGDLRRLLAHYGRDVASTYPTGVYWEGGIYGTAVSIPFPVALEAPFSPAVVGCTGN